MFGPRSPAYSIGQSSRLQSSPKEGPGPASYTLTTEHSKAISFPKASRLSHTISLNPGPGEYESISLIGKGPKPIIISRKVRNSSQICPGPSDYSPKIADSTVKYTFRKHHDLDHPNPNPGPGAYSPRFVSPKSPIAKIGKSKRTQSNSNVSPGPGSYNVPDSSKPKCFIFCKAVRESTPARTGPGPSDYSPNIEHSSKSALLVPRRPATAKNFPTPGPGAYNSEKISQSSPKWTISKSKKNNLMGSPNANDLKIQKGCSEVNYSGSTEISSPEKNERPKNKRFNSEGKIYSNQPGPCDYDVKDIWKKHPSAIFGTSRRKFSIIDQGPGPGEYNLIESLQKKGFSFTREKKIKRITHEGPGPGQYEIPHTIGSVI